MAVEETAPIGKEKDHSAQKGCVNDPKAAKKSVQTVSAGQGRCPQPCDFRRRLRLSPAASTSASIVTRHSASCRASLWLRQRRAPPRPGACARLSCRVGWTERCRSAPGSSHRHDNTGCVRVDWSYTTRMTRTVMAVFGAGARASRALSGLRLDKSAPPCLLDRDTHRAASSLLP